MGRAPCCDKSKVKKGPWSQEEDVKLKEYIDKNGTGGNWIALPQKAGLKRCGKSCRLRWLNYLRPNIRHGAFSNDEDRIICTLFATIGSRWSVIAAQLPGRTDNDIKNYWNTKLKKKLLGIPPSRRKPNVQQQEQQQQQQQLFSASDLESMPISSSLLQLEAIQLPPVHVHDDVSHQYQSSSYKLLMFGGPPEQISCSSSDQLEFGRVEGVGFDNYLYGGMDNHILQKPFLGGGGGGELTQDLQYGSYEDIKNLLGWHQQSMH